MLSKIMNSFNFLGSKNFIVCAREGGQTQHIFFLRRISRSEIRNSPKAMADFTDIIVAPENTGLAPKSIFKKANCKNK